MKNIFAYTEPGSSFPAFVSLNQHPDGRITLTVRAAGDGGRNMGDIVLPVEQMNKLAAAITVL